MASAAATADGDRGLSRLTIGALVTTCVLGYAFLVAMAWHNHGRLGDTGYLLMRLALLLSSAVWMFLHARDRHRQGRWSTTAPWLVFAVFFWVWFALLTAGVHLPDIASKVAGALLVGWACTRASMAKKEAEDRREQS